MSLCSIIGDSIAVGIAQFRPDCVSFAKQGVALYSINNQLFHVSKNTNTLIISTGSNDSYLTVTDVVNFRSQITAKEVIWILPMKKANKKIIKQVSNQFKDSFIDFSTVVSTDRIHPTF